jgi:AcrR family transcriptional regulator
MARPDKTRPYRSAVRERAAALRREAIVVAARSSFEERGWSGTTVAGVATAAGVSPKTVEAVFGTKAALLEAAVAYSLRGDTGAAPMPQREAVARMEAAPDAASMLDLHAAHLRDVNSRSADLAWVVEQAASADAAVAALWSQMNANRRFAVGWAVDTLAGKPGRAADPSRDEVATVFWVALDWSTYRTLTQHAGLDDDGYEEWLRRYYRATLLAAAPRRGR